MEKGLAVQTISRIDIFRGRSNVDLIQLKKDINEWIDKSSTTEFDVAWHSPAVSQANCISCHTSDPFIHDPWIDQAKMPNDSSQTVVPKFESPDLPYFAVGGYGSQWDNRSIHIEGNQ